MDAKAFNVFLEAQLEDIRRKLAVKGAEYVPGTEEVSRFHNFEIGAALNSESIEKTLWGFVTKHIVSLSDMVKVNSTDYDISVWDEKIGDVIIYMLLLHGMVTHTHTITEDVKSALCEDAKLPEVTVVVSDKEHIPDVSDTKLNAESLSAAWRAKVTPPTSAPRAMPQRV